RRAPRAVGRRPLRARVHLRARRLDRQLLQRARPMRRALLTASLLALALPAQAFAKGVFHPEDEFELHDWVPIHLGALNLSINKAVVYLLIGTVLTILLGLFLMRSR